MLNCVARVVCPALGLLMLATVTYAGGVDPGDSPTREPVVRERASASPAQTSAAVSKARRAVVPTAEEAPKSKPKPRAVTSASKDSWLLGSREGGCAPLSRIDRKVKVGDFETPQEFARKLQQRGYQAFVLDVGDVRDQMVRVKVPDLSMDLLFVRPGLCR